MRPPCARRPEPMLLVSFSDPSTLQPLPMVSVTRAWAMLMGTID
jgi:hypothetical protein